MAPPEGDHFFHEAEHVAVCAGQAPIEPAYFVVLAVGVVVAPLGPEDLVAGTYHGDSLAQHKKGHKVLRLLFPQCRDRGLAGFPLDAAVPTVVLITAVAIPFAVRFVVLEVVAHQVAQSEAVMAGDEIDAVGGQPAGRLIQVAAPRKARRDFTRQTGVAPHEAADDVAVSAVPLRPAVSREIADLV